ncbi:bifunctional 5,10-methylenetetrahydrofolate dehydrogenase/5,10-methenyltetrahydrofolate cyclohydrolase [Streptomyces caniscabiei]|uniref:bifunctional 5,10-methylenetetrahydrofolate dehydrogenase/5,10-methenyltetrahydrofolate cyclohydrolase n=1 Tax=Streptomyces caniscabiei TaxID=2746961 RepID=UPI0029AB1C25|nr:bifunctional 5,10-methylenetetrahydrofolate dehydrogenase/5,10-methenyltetrahydrofolate cyclohydrolase [Streptomyces caniscabiei]MDX2776646.1 bifunctional 5,10-methylenetetrahydrofolate dehydrogenase/5,10-methenyltetrahydrofolate cyclohydrolase [Streptomyces caniscabiei]
MAKLLSGTELVGYVKERQARQVRALRQAHHVFPKIVIIKGTHATPVIDAYIRMKQRYGDDILIESVVETLADEDMPAVIAKYNNDDSIHGIIVQLPINDPMKTDEIVDLIAPEKDIDGLGRDARFDSATALAINWLLAGYAVDLHAKKIALVGHGKLVGAPLARMWRSSGYDVTVIDRNHLDMASVLRESDVIVTATGVPRLITSDIVPPGAVVVDAGTASEDGGIVGDVDPAVRERNDIKITPEKGGVGPLTIAALFDNVIRSATRVAKQNETDSD